MQVLALGNYLTSRRVRSIGLPSALLDKFLFLWTGKYTGDDLRSSLDNSVITVTGKDWTGRSIPDGSTATFAVPDNATYLAADGTDDFWFDGTDALQEITHAELIVSTTMRTFVKYNDVSPFDVSAIGILKAGEFITESDQNILSTFFRLSAQYFGIEFNFNGFFKDNRDWIFPPVLGDLVDLDGNKYEIVTINNQEWIVESLKVTQYADGTPILNLTEAEVIDWYEPSEDELMALYNELYLYDVGSFTTEIYRSSTEAGSTTAFGWNFGVNTGGSYFKYLAYKTRPVRNFNSTTVYSLRDAGPSGGWIFHIIDLGGGNFTYYEAAPKDTVDAVYSNIDDVDIGISAQGTAIGTGQANTTAIIGQLEHTASGAKLCDEYSYGWISDTTGAYCWYDNDIANKADYGALYNWWAVDNVKGLAYLERGGVQEAGWRVPTFAEFTALITFLGGASIAGGHLKEVGYTHWESPNEGAIDSVGFRCRGAGQRDPITGVMGGIRYITRLWSSTPFDPTYSHMVSIDNVTEEVFPNEFPNAYGMSVRLFRGPLLPVKNGLLYNYYALSDSRDLAADGWHVPVIYSMENGYVESFIILTRFLNGGVSPGTGNLGEPGNDIGGILKESSSYWDAPNTDAINSVGFNLRGAGIREVDGTFSGIKQKTSLGMNDDYSGQTTANEATYDSATFRYTNRDDMFLIPFKTGQSVRLLKNSTTLSDGQSGTYTGNDGKVYRTICIGTQEWLADNLCETKYKNGDLITEVTDGAAWAALSTEALCAYNNDWDNI